MKFSVLCEKTRKLFDTFLHSVDEEEEDELHRHHNNQSHHQRNRHHHRRPSPACTYAAPSRASRGRDVRLFSTDSKRRRRATALLYKSSNMRRSWQQLNKPTPENSILISNPSLMKVNVIEKLPHYQKSAASSTTTAPPVVDPNPGIVALVQQQQEQKCPRLQFNSHQEPDVVDREQAVEVVVPADEVDHEHDHVVGQLSVLTVDCKQRRYNGNSDSDSGDDCVVSKDNQERGSPSSFSSSGCSSSSPSSSSSGTGGILKATTSSYTSNICIAFPSGRVTSGFTTKKVHFAESSSIHLSGSESGGENRMANCVIHTAV